MNRRKFLSKTGKLTLASILLPYISYCGNYEVYDPEILKKSGVILQRPVDGEIDIETTKDLFLENPEIYESNELIFDIINEAYFSFFNSEIPEILTVDYDTLGEIMGVVGGGVTGYYEQTTKTIHLLQGLFMVDNVNRLFHELGHNIERTYCNEDKKEHLSQAIEFALGLESLLLFPELVNIEDENDWRSYHPFLNNLYQIQNNEFYGKFGTDDYINGETTTMFYLNKNRGDLQNTIQEMLNTPIFNLDQKAIEILEQETGQKDLTIDTYSLLIENEIDPKIPYNEKDNEYYNTIIKKLDRKISPGVFNFIDFLR